MSAADHAEIPPKISADKLAHIPTRPGLPVLGHTLKFLKDPLGNQRRSFEEFGPVFRSNTFFAWSVTLAGPDALEMVLMDREKNFSSRIGWHNMLGKLFSNGLMLRDFDDHRAHRKTMQVAFKPAPMKDYLKRMNGGIAGRLDQWGQKPKFKFYWAIKGLTLDIGAAVFLGMDTGPEADRMNQAFIDEVAASISVVRKPIPGLKMWKGIKARTYLSDLFREMIPERRHGDGDDMFSQLCRATDDDGNSLSDDEIVDHMNFLLMAAHDTTTSSLTTMIWALAAHPEWQEQLRAEIEEIGGDEITYEDLATMEKTERVFKEALRLTPPVPFIPRRTVREFEFEGVTIPANTNISVSPGFVHMMPELWTDPEKFDPDRFSPNRAEDRNHKFAWSPFGGGAHKCLGIHFAYMQVKAFTFQLLKQYRVKLPAGYEPTWKRIPIPQPKDGLPIILERI